jgi:hypothetical protein
MLNGVYHVVLFSKKVFTGFHKEVEGKGVEGKTLDWVSIGLKRAAQKLFRVLCRREWQNSSATLSGLGIGMFHWTTRKHLLT